MRLRRFHLSLSRHPHQASGARTSLAGFGMVLGACCLVLLSSLAFAATQTLTGVITDDMCGKKHTMMPGQSNAQCVRECVRSGAHYALQAGEQMYILTGDSKQLDALAGKKVKVTGDVSGKTLAVKTIAESK